mmetsp:Transcript_34115/g.70465  ORF Transcript_34115/g.70465 Transcript_34115/m.70465 type:complete len:207 (-) Transcript_34115:1324-1944(-)
MFAGFAPHVDPPMVALGLRYREEKAGRGRWAGCEDVVSVPKDADLPQDVRRDGGHKILGASAPISIQVLHHLLQEPLLRVIQHPLQHGHGGRTLEPCVIVFLRALLLTAILPLPLLARLRSLLLIAFLSSLCCQPLLFLLPRAAGPVEVRVLFHHLHEGGTGGSDVGGGGCEDAHLHAAHAHGGVVFDHSAGDLAVREDERAAVVG